MTEWVQALVLGVLQGLTEFLPISSSAHLRIVPEVLGWDDPGAAFTAVIQIGTETAVILYFARDIWRIVTAWARSLLARRADRAGDWDPDDARMGWYVIAGSLPIVVVGIAFKDVIEGDFRSLWVIGTTLVVLGVILGVADRVGTTNRPLASLTLPHAVAFGAAQALAVIPGVSRSGATISMGLFLGYERAACARFAFLLAIPAVLGAGLFEWPTALTEGSEYGLGPLLLATGAAFAVGFAVIAWLFRWLEHGSYAPFVVYRIVLGVLVLGLAAGGVIDA
ncbi:MAG TPA: undecaprenyl-diphosphate phosphatase [Jiangellaceae bacterium]|nr:undecaprenyl-diphosphate phosphatase [Jiangellaceae bacterium]